MKKTRTIKLRLSEYEIETLHYALTGSKGDYYYDMAQCNKSYRKYFSDRISAIKSIENKLQS